MVSVMTALILRNAVMIMETVVATTSTQSIALNAYASTMRLA
jgi:hypothetical protein